MNILWPFSCEITVQNVSTINVETTNSGNTVNAFNNVTMGKSLHTKNVQFSLFELFFLDQTQCIRKIVTYVIFLLSKICNWRQKNIINSLMLHMHSSVYAFFGSHGNIFFIIKSEN